MEPGLTNRNRITPGSNEGGVNAICIKNIRESKTHIEIMDKIISYIVYEQLSPGERLPGERGFAKILGIGRNCLRESLKALQVIGVIETRVGKGSFVRKDAIETIKRIGFL